MGYLLKNDDSKPPKKKKPPGPVSSDDFISPRGSEFQNTTQGVLWRVAFGRRLYSCNPLKKSDELGNICKCAGITLGIRLQKDKRSLLKENPTDQLTDLDLRFLGCLEKVTQTSPPKLCFFMVMNPMVIRQKSPKKKIQAYMDPIPYRPCMVYLLTFG